MLQAGASNPSNHARAGMTAWLRSAAIATALIGAAGPACAQGQTARNEAWRHGIIEPKGDAGFQVMAVRAGYTAKQGLKLALPSFQNDGIMLRRLLAGGLESYGGGRAPRTLRGRATPAAKTSAGHGRNAA